MTDPNPERRWHHFTPGRFVLGLLAAETFLFLSDHYQWLAFNERKGWTVLIGVAALAAGVVLLLTWFAMNLVRRRRFQFGLKTLAVFAVVCAVVCSWFEVKMGEAMQQRRAVAALREAHWVVRYDYEGTVPHKSGPPAPVWLVNLMGTDFFADVERLWRSPWGGTSLKHVNELPKVSYLDAQFSNVTDADLEQLAGLTRLWYLNLSGTQVTDAGLEHLQGLTSLEQLFLTGTQVTDAGLKYLDGPHNTPQVTNVRPKHRGHHLQWLDLAGTQVTDEGVERLRKALPDCEIQH